MIADIMTKPLPAKDCKKNMGVEQTVISDGPSRHAADPTMMGIDGHLSTWPVRNVEQGAGLPLVVPLFSSCEVDVDVDVTTMTMISSYNTDPQKCLGF
jgi:hypothetical protein